LFITPDSDPIHLNRPRSDSDLIIVRSLFASQLSFTTHGLLIVNLCNFEIAYVQFVNFVPKPDLTLTLTLAVILTIILCVHIYSE